jgi:hypothetical protein
MQFYAPTVELYLAATAVVLAVLLAEQLLRKRPWTMDLRGSRKAWSIGLLVVSIVAVALYAIHTVWLRDVTGNPRWLDWVLFIAYMIPMWVGILFMRLS